MEGDGKRIYENLIQQIKWKTKFQEKEFFWEIGKCCEVMGVGLRCTLQGRIQGDDLCVKTLIVFNFIGFFEKQIPKYP